MAIEPNLHSCCTQDQALESSSPKSLNKIKKVFEYNKIRKKAPFHKKRHAISRSRTAADFTNSK